MKQATLGLYFEEFELGAEIVHAPSKTIFESDNNLFCLLTMNPHPVHTNIDYASKSEHEKILVAGTLVFSLVASFSVPDISGKAIANLLYENIQHLAPVFINDTLYAKTRILELIPSKSKNDRGIVYVETVGYNQNGVDVIKFRRKVLIKRREQKSNDE